MRSYTLLGLIIAYTISCDTANSDRNAPLVEAKYEYESVNGYPDFIQAHSNEEIESFIASLPHSMRKYTEVNKFGNFEFNFLDGEYLEDLRPLNNADSIKIEFENFLLEYSKFTNIVDTTNIYFYNPESINDNEFWHISTSEQYTSSGFILPYTGYRLGLTSKGITSIQGIWYEKDIFVPPPRFEPQISAVEAIDIVVDKSYKVCGIEGSFEDEHVTGVYDELVTHDQNDKRYFLYAWVVEFGNGTLEIFVDKVSGQIFRITDGTTCYP
ncbi:MAG: hypothetical protein JJ966_02810 [Balneolaceae bacterium]|nr:hypothetical protein [Balneolaceae bacterium]